MNTAAKASLADSQTFTAQVGSLTWHYIPSYQMRLFTPNAPDWSDLDNDPNASLVKQNPIRSVYKVCFASDNPQYYHAKLYNTASLRARLKNLLGPCPAQQEFEKLHIAHKRSLPVPRPLAWANGKSKNRKPICLMLTQSINAHATLEQIIWADPKPNPDLLDDALTAAAHVVARMHCFGIQHNDLHPGNILLVSNHDKNQPDTQNVHACVTDLKSAHIENRSGHASALPDHPRRLADLAVFVNALRRRIDQSQIRTFLHAYLHALNPYRKWSSRDLESFTRTICHKADVHARRVFADRDRRAKRNSKYASHIKLSDGFSAKVFLQCKHPVTLSHASQYTFTPQQWQQTLQNPLQLLNDAHTLKQGNQSTVVAKKCTVGPASLDVVAKHIRILPTWKHLSRRIRPSNADRQYLAANALIIRNIPTAFPLAAIRQRKFGILQQSFLLCEKIPNALSLNSLLRDHPFPPPAERRLLAQHLGRLLASLKRSGLQHRDCKAPNIMVARQPDNSCPFQLFFVDTAGIRNAHLFPEIPPHNAIVRLAVSLLRFPKIKTSDYLRAFHAYLQKLDLPHPKNRSQRHSLFKKLAQKAQSQYNQKISKTQKGKFNEPRP